MSLTLILVRHGQAANKRLGQTDFERELTPAGRDALARAYAETFHAYKGKPLELWVSPAERARQTASELCAATEFDFAEAEELSCLYEQDADEFLARLQARVAEGPGTVVAVGHIPFMEDLSAWLGGIDLPFRPGAAAAFSIEGELAVNAYGMPPAQLLWFVQGPRV